MMIVFAAFTMQGILSTLIKWCGGIAIAALLIFLVKDVIGLAKGTGDSSIGKIAVKVISVILVIGIMYLATSYETWGQNASKIGGSVIDTVIDEGTSATGGGGSASGN